MADMEGLGDVDGGIVHANMPAAPQVCLAIILARFQNPGQHPAGIGGLVGEEVEIPALGLAPGDARGQGQGSGQLRGDGRRGFAQAFCQAEAGEGIVPHGRVRRGFQPAGKFLGVQAGLLGQGGGQSGLIVHVDLQ